MLCNFQRKQDSDIVEVKDGSRTIAKVRISSEFKHFRESIAAFFGVKRLGIVK